MIIYCYLPQAIYIQHLQLWHWHGEFRFKREKNLFSSHSLNLSRWMISFEEIPIDIIRHCNALEKNSYIIILIEKHGLGLNFHRSLCSLCRFLILPAIEIWTHHETMTTTELLGTVKILHNLGPQKTLVLISFTSISDRLRSQYQYFPNSREKCYARSNFQLWQFHCFTS